MILGGLYYINNVFLPIQLKELINSKAQTALKRDIDFSHINYQPFRGFVIKNITIFRKDAPNLPLIHIKEVRFNILFAPLLQRQELVIPSVTIKEPFFHLIRYQDQQWNFADLLQKPASQKQQKGLRLFLGKIKIEKGQIETVDLLTDPAVKILLNNIFLTCKYSLTKRLLDFSLNSEIYTAQSTFSSKGTLQLPDKKLQTQLKAKNIDLIPLLKMFYHNEHIILSKADISQADISIATHSKGAWKIKGDFSGKTNAQFNTKNFKNDFSVQGSDIFYDGENYKFQGKISLNKAELEEDGIKIAQGNLLLKANQIIFLPAKNAVDIKGHLQMTPVYINPNTTFSLSAGGLDIAELHYLRSKQAQLLTGELSLQQCKVISDAHSFKFDSLQSPFVLNQGNRKMDVTLSSPSIKKADLLVSKKSFLAEEINLKESVLRIVGSDTTFKTALHAVNMKAALTETVQFIGNPSAELTIQHFPADIEPWSYVGALQFSNDRIVGINKVGEIKDISGYIKFTQDRLKTPQLTFVAKDTQVTLSGSMSNFSNPYLGIVLSAESFDLSQLNTLFADKLQELQIVPKGRAAVELSFTGQALYPKDAQLEVNAELDDVEVISAKLPAPVTHMSGYIQYMNNYLSWKNLTGNFYGKTYSLTGEFRDFQQPLITTQVTSEDVQALVKLNIDQQKINIDTLKGNYYNSVFDIFGEADLQESGPPQFTLKGAFSIDLDDIQHLSPGIREKIDPFGLHGILSVKCLFQGDINTWKTGIISLNASGPKLSVKGYSLNKLNLLYQRTKSFQSKLTVSASLYGGDMKVTSLSNINNALLPSKVSLLLTDLNLAQISKDAQWKKKDLSGTLSLQLQAEGPLLQTENITGQGSISILNGEIWTLSLLKGLGKLLFIPEFEGVVFTKGSADFNIRDNRISTQNLLLISKSMEMRGKGWIDKKKNIQMDVNPKFYETEILRSESLKKLPTAIISQADNYMNIKISGSLDKPQFHIDTSPISVIKKTADVLIEGTTDILMEGMQSTVEGVQGIVEDILQ